MFDSMFDIFACPRCRRTLEVMDVHTGLMCIHCRLVYPIREEIPFLTREAAVPLAEWQEGIRLPGEKNALKAVAMAAPEEFLSMDKASF